MKSNPELEQCVWEVGNGEVGDGLEQVERHVGDLAGVLHAVRFRKSTGHHVGVAYRLHLVHVVLVEYRVKCSEGEDDNVKIIIMNTVFVYAISLAIKPFRGALHFT